MHIDSSAEERHTAYARYLDSCSTLYIGGGGAIGADTVFHDGTKGFDRMSLLCVLTYDDFVIVASDTKYLLPHRENGGDVFGDKFFRIDGTNLIIGSTGGITYGKRHFHNLVFDEINTLEDKSFYSISDYIRHNFGKYIEETAFENFPAMREHYSHVHLVGWEGQEFRCHVFGFTKHGTLYECRSMTQYPKYCFSGAEEGCQILREKIEMFTAGHSTATERECDTFLATAFSEIIEHYNQKPPLEQVIGGDVMIDVLRRP